MADNPPSVGIKDLLATHIGTSGWVIEIGQFPDAPDRVIMIMDTGGLDPNPKWLLDFPTVQTLVRGDVGGYLDTFKEAKAIKDILLGIDSFDTPDGDHWDGITQNGDIASAGRDESMRPLFSGNFSIILEPQVVANSNRLAL